MNKLFRWAKRDPLIGLYLVGIVVMSVVAVIATINLLLPSGQVTSNLPQGSAAQPTPVSPTATVAPEVTATPVATATVAPRLISVNQGKDSAPPPPPGLLPRDPSVKTAPTTPPGGN